MKPLIGITVDALPDPNDNRTRGKLTLNWNYAQAVADAGGVPLLIPPQADTTAIAGLIDGLLIPGGNDIDASNWGETNHPSVTTIAPERFAVEQALYQAVPPALPILGICYCCQFINVMQGGSLIQHLPDSVGHEDDQRGNLQRVSLDPCSQASEALGATVVTGESWHHQAIRDLGRDLRVVGKNQDGTVEAIESTSRPWMLGVQWHPERTSDSAETQRLFRQFVEAATEYRRSRAQ